VHDKVPAAISGNGQEAMIELDRPILIGMVHLPALPGSAGYAGSMSAVIEHAVRDAVTLADAGFGVILIENFGDAPFTPGRVAASTVAAFAIAAHEVARATKRPIGINVLRNDAASALGIAAAVGAALIRVNVHTGVAATDQGIIEGRAQETLELRQRVAPDVGIFADVHVKHATPLSQPDIALAAEETAYRGRADALIVSGAATGQPPDRNDVNRVRLAVPDRPVLIGSGATVETVQEWLRCADGVIVGSALKAGRRIEQPIDAESARAFVAAARTTGEQP
jgi:membrane complex biogenesis BtpA family protein